LNARDHTEIDPQFRNEMSDAMSPTVTPKKSQDRGRRGHRPSSLRPPTLMIDLLFGALMLFAFQMGDPNAQKVQTHDIKIPTAADKNHAKPAQIVALTPVHSTGGAWAYKMSDGRVMSASGVAKIAKLKNKTLILVVAKSESVQNYLDAEQPLRQLGLNVGLAVAIENGAPQ
jgi:hypothetical protein